MRSFITATLCLTTLCLAPSARAQDLDPQVASIADQGPICIDTSSPVLVPPAVEMVARLAAFELPANLSVTQYRRLQQAARHFRAGRERQALQHFGQAVTAAAVAVGPANLSDADIESLSFIVMADAAESADVELQVLLAEIRSINAQKRAILEHITALQGIRVVGYGENDGFDEEGNAAGIAVAVEVRIDELSDQLGLLQLTGQDAQLELEAYTDRNQHQLAILTNILKKCSDTAAAIVANLK